MKTILEELREAMEELKKSEAERVYTAIENREFPPIVMNPIVVSKKVNEVLLNHKMTMDELFTLMSHREVDPAEFQMLCELRELENQAKAEENKEASEETDGAEA